jgi:iron complex outermembrane receptor protein
VPPAASACPLLPGSPVTRRDALASWDEGLVFVLLPGLSAYGGYSSAAYPIFNTEEPESVGQTPERGDQIEAGLRYDAQSWLSLSSALYRATRANVFTLLTVPNPSGPGDIDIPQVFSYRVKGWETDVNLKPVDDVGVLANFALQTPDITGYPQTPADIGHSVPSVPATLANVWATYTLPVFAETGRPSLSFGLRYRDHEFADAANTRLLPGVPLFDATAAIPFGHWLLQAGVSNIAGRRNYVDAAGTGGGAVPGLPRTYFVKLGTSTG